MAITGAHVARAPRIRLGMVGGGRDAFLAGSIPSDAVANPLKTPKPLDVEVDQPARLLVLLPHNWRGRGQVVQPRQSGAAHHPADRGRRNPGLLRNVPTAEALAA